jgi:hypothetical protein
MSLEVGLSGLFSPIKSIIQAAMPTMTQEKLPANRTFECLAHTFVYSKVELQRRTGSRGSTFERPIRYRHENEDTLCEAAQISAR